MRYNKFLQTVFLAVFVGVCLCSFLYIMEAEAAQEAKDVVKENKTISGKVGFINSEFIAIIDHSDADQGFEHETLLYLDQDVEIMHRNSLGDIRPGDTVQVQYEKTTKTSKDVRKSKHAAKTIKFLKAADDEDSSLRSGKK